MQGDAKAVSDIVRLLGQFHSRGDDVQVEPSSRRKPLKGLKVDVDRANLNRGYFGIWVELVLNRCREVMQSFFYRGTQTCLLI